MFEMQTGKESDHVSEDEKKLMKQYGITTEQKIVYHYLGFRYDRLTDALNYAGIDQERRSAQGEPKA